MLDESKKTLESYKQNMGVLEGQKTAKLLSEAPKAHDRTSTLIKVG